MFKQRTLYSFYCLLLTCMMSCNNSSEKIPGDEPILSKETTEAISSTAGTVEYICPMECDGSRQNKAGICPVCNMKLVRLQETETAEVKAIKSTEGSVYELGSDWTTQNGDEIQLKDLSDNYQLVCMIFTACPHACPNLVGDMVAIDEALQPKTREKVNYLLVTIDPDNDTPKQLATYARNMDLNTDRWTLLHGEKQDIRTLSNLLGVEYKQYDNGSFGHTNYLTLLNKKGEIIYRLNGINMPNEDMLAFMHENL